MYLGEFFMKKLSLFIAGFVGITFMLTGVAATTNNIGIVNFQKIMQTMPAMQAARTKIQKQFAPTQAKITAQQKKLENTMKQYKRNSVVMQKKDLQKTQKQILSARTNLTKMMQAYQQKMFTAQQLTVKKLIGKVKSAVAKVAKQKNMKVVIMQAAAAYSDPSLDITTPVQKLLK